MASPTEGQHCIAATLGALVVDSLNRYLISSNNHAVSTNADPNGTQVADPIQQPGSVDLKPCGGHRTAYIANFTSEAPISFNNRSSPNLIDASASASQVMTDSHNNRLVQAAVANIGPYSAVMDTDFHAGAKGKAMSRTSWFRKGKIMVAHTGTFALSYEPEDPNSPLAFFNDQMIIDMKMDEGDSGSVIFTDEPCPRFVGLQFAVSSDGKEVFASNFTNVFDGALDPSASFILPVGDCLPKKSGAPLNPDGSAFVSQSEAAAASPSLWNEANVNDPKNVADESSASAVMGRHPELHNLADYLSEMVGGDFVNEAKTADGRDLAVIIVVVDDTNPNTGPATLAQARSQAPASVEGVQVRVIGTSIFTAASPSSAIISPQDDDTVTGVVTIDTQVDSGVSWINVYIDGNYFASSPPSTFSWNSTAVPNGSHTISANAYNSGSALVGSSSVPVNVQNKPVTVLSPATGANVTGTVTIAAQAIAGVQWINFYVDGNYLASSPPFDTNWNSATVAPGMHTISTTAYGSNNQAMGTDQVTVGVAN